MPLFQRLFSKRPFHRSDDSFTLTDSGKMTTLCEWVRQQTKAKRRVIVLSHFQSTFLQNQMAMDEAGIDFDVLAEPLDEWSFGKAMIAEKQAGVVLTMSQMLQSTLTVADEKTSNESCRTTTPKANTSRVEAPESFSVIVTERYPITSRDDQLELFFRNTKLPITLGYLISFDDPILRHLLGKRFIDLLKQMGMGANDLVSSTMTQRQLTRQLAKATKSVESEQFASSPEEWIQLNLE